MSVQGKWRVVETPDYDMAVPGAYILFCSLPGHESLGIKGKLIVAP